MATLGKILGRRLGTLDHGAYISLPQSLNEDMVELVREANRTALQAGTVGAKFVRSDLALDITKDVDAEAIDASSIT